MSRITELYLKAERLEKQAVAAGTEVSQDHYVAAAAAFAELLEAYESEGLHSTVILRATVKLYCKGGQKACAQALLYRYRQQSSKAEQEALQLIVEST